PHAGGGRRRGTARGLAEGARAHAGPPRRPHHERAEYRSGGDASRALRTCAGSRWLRALESDRGPVQVVCGGALDLHGGEFADPQRAVRRHIDGAVDLRGVALAAAFRYGRADLVDHDLLAGADMALETARRDRLRAPHEAMPALLLDLGRHRRTEIVGRRAPDRLVAKAA